MLLSDVFGFERIANFLLHHNEKHAKFELRCHPAELGGHYLR